MKVLLIRPKYQSILVNLEPLGLEYVGGMLKGIGIEYDVFDGYNLSPLFFFTRLRMKISREKFTHVGFHVNANSSDYCLKTALKLKKHFPEIKILMGGPHLELNYRDYCTEAVDYICYDNGLVSLENCFKKEFHPEVLKKATGIAFKDEAGNWVFKDPGPAISSYHIKPDRSHFYQFLKKNFILGKGSFAIVRGSFSCPYRCSFCYCTQMNGGEYRERAMDGLIEDIRDIQHDKIWIMDDDFLVSPERVENFCNRIIKEKLNKQFMIYGRADSVVRNVHLMPKLYQAGVRDVMVGLEAVTDELLNDYQKQTTKKINEEAIDILHRNRIICNGLFVISHTSKRSYFRNLRTFIRKNKLLWVVFGIFAPYKGTPAYEEYKNEVQSLPSKMMDGTHVTVKPLYMSRLELKLRFYLLHFPSYAKLLFRIIRRTAYDIEMKG